MSIHAALGEHLAHRAMDQAVTDLIERAAAVPGLASRLERAGIDPASVRSVADLSALPVLSKDDLVAEQASAPPFGGLLAPGADVRRVFQSPGPLYEPQLESPDYWRWGQVFRHLGVGSEDTAINCFGYHLSPAGAMMEEGLRSTGAAVLPAGIGNQDLQARAIADLGVSTYSGLPSYLKALIDRFDELGLPPQAWQLTRAMVTAEPLPDSLRAELTARVPSVCMAYGTGETGLLAHEVGDGAGLVLAEGVLVQICEIGTGTPIEDETEGEVVVTVLRTDYPLVRFGTGDLSGWMVGPDGSLRLRGVLGRTGSAVKVKGMFLHPAQIASVMSRISAVADHRFVIGRTDHLDTLRCEVVLAPGNNPDEQLQQITERIREGLRFRADVVAVDELTPADGPILDTRTWE